MRSWLRFNRFDLIVAGVYFGWATEAVGDGKFFCGAGFFALSLVLGYFAWKATENKS